MWEVATFTNKGGHGHNYDALACHAQDQTLLCVLCDGMNGACGGDTAAQYALEVIMDALHGGDAPAQAIVNAENAFAAYRAERPALKKACTTACALQVTGQEAHWANLGDSRLYHFSGGRLARVSHDDSAAYQVYLAGNVAYADIRMHPYRAHLRACIGDEKSTAPHTEAFTLSPGDALLLCSDGFWQYIYETEMEIDLAKSQDPRAWQEAMLLRIAHRSHLQGDNLSAICCMAGADMEGEA